MSKIYQLTKEIHLLISKINQEYSLKIEIKNEKYIYINNNTLLSVDQNTGELQKLDAPYYAVIQAPQIRQILIDLREVIADSNKVSFCYEYCESWLDGLIPLIDREPKTVLQELIELLEILQNIK